MQLNSGAVDGCGAPDGMQLRCRERELVAQLHELLFPSTTPSPPSGASSADLSVDHCISPVMAPASCIGAGKRGRKGRKRAREDERHLQEEQKQRGGGCSVATKAARCRRKKEATTTKTILTTVPDFDGYQWKKYGQKQIEAAKYPRSYYRCTNSMDQACPAKRTVQRNEDGDGDGGPPKYTVVYISEHSCRSSEAVAAPVILETTVRTKTSSSAPDIASVCPNSSSAISTGTQSPASSDITWSGGAVASGNLSPRERGDCSSLFAVDGGCWEWDTSTTSHTDAPMLLREMDFAGPIMSPVHVAETDGSWINDFFVTESPFVLNSCQLFGF